jgi:hypothetical protein
VVDDRERRECFERMWRDAAAAAAGEASDDRPEPTLADVGALLARDETPVPWWWR